MHDSPRQILDHISELMWTRWKDHDRYLLLTVIRKLVLGKSIDIESLHSVPELTLERIRLGLESGRYDLDEEGRIGGAFGVTVMDEMPFTIRHRNASIRVCCGLVAIMVAQLIGDRCDVCSQDPTTGKTIRLVMDKRSVVASQDSSGVIAVVVAPVEEKFLDDMWNSFCRYIRFYESAETLPDLASMPAPARPASLDDMVESASSVGERLWGDARSS